MAKRVGVDKWIFCTTLALVVAGLLMIFSASAVMASARYGSAYSFVVRQAVWALAGLLAMWALMHINYRKLNNPVGGVSGRGRHGHPAGGGVFWA